MLLQRAEPGVIAIAGWLLPGLGHALQRMWGRAAVVFVCVGILVIAGASMRGNLFTSNGSDAFDTLGYVADLGAGSFYFLARALETAAPTFRTRVAITEPDSWPPQVY